VKSFAPKRDITSSPQISDRDFVFSVVVRSQDLKYTSSQHI